MKPSPGGEGAPKGRMRWKAEWHLGIHYREVSFVLVIGADTIGVLMNNLTDNYEQTDSKKFVPETIFELPGFESQKDAEDYILQLQSKYPSDKYNIRVRVILFLMSFLL